MTKVGIIICDRYKSCDGGKCFRSVRNRDGAFSIYNKVEVVGYSSCGGCPGGNIEGVVNGMKRYGAEAIHFATGVLAGYPPCPYLENFIKYTEIVTGLKAVVGTHSMPTNYINIHGQIGDWTPEHKEMLHKFNLMVPEETVLYDSTLDDYDEKLQKELN